MFLSPWFLYAVRARGCMVCWSCHSSPEHCSRVTSFVIFL